MVLLAYSGSYRLRLSLPRPPQVLIFAMFAIVWVLSLLSVAQAGVLVSRASCSCPGSCGSTTVSVSVY